MSTRAASRAISIRLALLGLLYYSCIFLIKASMFACSWSRQPSFLGLSYKTLLALAQTFGYAAGKVPSLLYSPKLPPQRLRGALVAVVLIAGGNVLLSCITPASMSLLLVFHACVWLAPTWSLLQRFFEGRRDTEAIVALVSFSYIGCSGLCKGLAVDLVTLAGFSESEAVATCAIIGMVVGVMAAYGVAAQPPPSADDVAKRGRRKPMVNYSAELGAFLSDNFGVSASAHKLAACALSAHCNATL